MYGKLVALVQYEKSADLRQSKAPQRTLAAVIEPQPEVSNDD